MLAPAEVVRTSAITPEPGLGSVPSALPSSAVLVVSFVYKTTHAGALIAIFNSAYDLNPVMFKSVDASFAILPVVPAFVVLESSVTTV